MFHVKTLDIIVGSQQYIADLEKKPREITVVGLY